MHQSMIPNGTDVEFLRRENHCLRRQVEALEKFAENSRHKIGVLSEKLFMAEDVKAALLFAIFKQATSLQRFGQKSLLLLVLLN